MNYKLIFSMIGSILKYECLLMFLPLFVSLLYKESITPFIITVVLLFIFSYSLKKLNPRTKYLQLREGFIIVALSWIALSVFGAMPFYFSGYFESYIDCFFEAVSGFTTTGASILSDIEVLPKGILFWRSFTHWIGGMGILVFALAIMPKMNGSAVSLLKAESPGPNPGKIVPKIKDSAKIMYIMYLALTIIQIILLIIFGMPVFDSFIHSFGTAGTGGFSCMNLSMGAYNDVPVEIVTTIFMILFGINFNVYFYILNKNFKQFFKNEEVRLYLGIIFISTLVIAIDIVGMYQNSWSEAFRHSSFQVATIITTTGFSTTDFNLWPTLSKVIIIILMFLGANAGSTGGGIKTVRILLLFKKLKVELAKIIHPRVVNTVKSEGKTVDSNIMHSIMQFFFIYIVFIVLGTLLISVDNYDIETTVTAVISAVSNIGPGLGLVGPTSNFSIFSKFSKMVLSFCMLAGRLEFLPMLLIFMPSIWKKNL